MFDHFGRLLRHDTLEALRGEKPKGKMPPKTQNERASFTIDGSRYMTVAGQPLGTKSWLS